MRYYREQLREISLAELSEQFGMTDKEILRELNRTFDQYLHENLLKDGSDCCSLVSLIACTTAWRA